MGTRSDGRRPGGGPNPWEAPGDGPFGGWDDDDRVDDWDDDDWDDDDYSLQEQRLDAVVAAIRASGANSALDLGCGPGDLLVRLAREPGLDRIVGLDLSASALALARERVGHLAPRVVLQSGSFTVPSAGFAGFDAAALVETIEHVDPDRLGAVEAAVFGAFAPGTVVVTTPNVEYNPCYGLTPGERRHPDHRFEWDRARFRAWSEGVARRHGYRVTLSGIGLPDALRGPPTQMAVFSR